MTAFQHNLFSTTQAEVVQPEVIVAGDHQSSAGLAQYDMIDQLLGPVSYTHLTLPTRG